MAIKVLVVEDEPAIRLALGEYLAIHGFEVQQTEEREEAEAMLSRHSFDIVLTDLRLTGAYGTEGLDILAYVREHCPTTRTILLTAHLTPDVEREANIRQAAACLRKPTPLGVIAETILAVAGTE